MEWVVLGSLAAISLAVILYSNITQRMSRIEGKLNALLSHHGVDVTHGPPLSDRVKQLAATQERKIEAIKVYREETGASLAEAKDAVK
jgi:hypothetical protein